VLERDASMSCCHSRDVSCHGGIRGRVRQLAAGVSRAVILFNQSYPYFALL
jgi:hypothetical protein